VGTTGMESGMEIRRLGAATEADAIQLVNTYTRGWPYSRPIGPEVVAHWRTLGARYQPEHALVAYRGGEARAFVHAERRDDTHTIHLLAATAQSAHEGALLLREVEKQAGSDGATSLWGPGCLAQAFYGGYVLGLEPYHPHWATAVTDLYVQAGFAMVQSDVIMSALPSARASEGRGPTGYELAEVTAADEFKARTFRFAAMLDGREVSSCTGRLYPDLRSASEGAIGQLGPVETHKSHRMKGLASALVEISLNRLWGMGAGEVLVSTGPENASALRIYEKAGFVRRHNVNEWSKPVLSRNSSHSFWRASSCS